MAPWLIVAGLVVEITGIACLVIHVRKTPRQAKAPLRTLGWFLVAAGCLLWAASGLLA